MDHFGPKNGTSSYKNFSYILYNENGQWVDESNNKGLYQKNFLQDNWATLDPWMAHPHNSGSTLKNFLKICKMKGTDRYIVSSMSFLRKSFIWGNFIFLAFRPFFTVCLGMVKIEPGHCHCYYWILKWSGHDFFHDYYWILKHDKDS